MDSLRAFLEQQTLLLMFLVIGLGYAAGAVNIKGFNLGGCGPELDRTTERSY